MIPLKKSKFIKAVSNTVFDVINAAYHDKPLIFIRAIRLILSRLFSDTILDKINAVYYDKSLILIRAVRLSLSRQFLTMYLT